MSTPPDTSKVDATLRVLRMIPDSGRTSVMTPVVYTAIATPTFVRPYKLAWNIDGTLIERANTDTLSVTFATAGVHSVRVTWLDSAGKEVASDTTIATVAVIHTPNDTTSHVFAWNEYTIGQESSLNSVFVFDSAHIYVTGDKLWWLTGNQWVPVTMKDKNGHEANGAFGPMRLFGFSTTDFWLCGGDGVIHDSGSTQVLFAHLVNQGVMSDADGALRAAWGTSSKNMYFVGEKGTIIHFDGTTWTNLPKVTTNDIRSIYGTSDHNIWACGWSSSTGRSVLLHFDGLSWSLDPLSSSVETENLWACDSGGHTFAYTGGGWLERKRDSGPWIRDSAMPNGLPDGTNSGVGFRGNGPNDVIIAGGWGVVAHWSGKTWKKYDQFFDYGQAFYGAAGSSMKDNTVCIVGVKSGGSWILLGRR